MAGTKLFNPSESLAIRPPMSNSRYHGNIVNPPRFAELGGLKSSNEGDQKNDLPIVHPGNSQRAVPQTTKAKSHR